MNATERAELAKLTEALRALVTADNAYDFERAMHAAAVMPDRYDEEHRMKEDGV